MAEITFGETSPWAAALRRGRFGATTGEAGVTIVESGQGTMALVSARRGHGADLFKVATAWGIDLPTSGRWLRGRGRTVLWAGPGQWLVRAPGPYAALESELAALVPHATLIDQSHSRASVTVGGPKARDVLAKGFEIDLHPRAFRTGDVAMTIAVGLSALLWQIDDAPTFEIAVPRSMAGSFWHWLSEAAGEFGYRVEASA